MSFLIDSSIMITSQVSLRRPQENPDLLRMFPSPGSEG